MLPEREQEIRDPDRPMFSAEYAQGVIVELLAALDAERASNRDPHHVLRVLADECMESGLELGELVEEIRSQVLAPEPALSSKGRTTAFEAENPGSSPGSADHLRNLEAVAEAARTLNALHRDVLGLPTLSQDNLDAAVAAWAVLRAALAVLEEPQ